MLTNLFLSVVGISISVSLVVLALVLTAPLFNRRYAVKWKYFIWIFLALRLLIPFSGSEIRAIVDRSSDHIISGDAQGENDSGSRQLITLEIPRRMADPVIPPSENSGGGIALLDVLAYVWFAGSLCMLAFYLYAYVRCRVRLKNAGIPMEDRVVLEQYGRLLEEMGVRRHLRMVEDIGAASPMVMGFARPVLVLPPGRYSAEELRFILKHELIHLKRHDVYLKLLLVVANTMHWFNPVIWLMRKEAVVDMELSCDEKVIQGAGFTERKAYTETLISTLHQKAGKRAVLSTQFYGGKQVMKKRFKNILVKMNKKNGIPVFLCAVVLTVGLGMLVGCSVMNPDQGLAEDDGVGMDLEQTLTENNEQVPGQPMDGSENIASGQYIADGGEAEGIPEGIDAPDMVLDEAEKWIAYLASLDEAANYTDWRIQSLAHCHTYEDIDGMVLQVYRMNFEFWAEHPENVLFAGGKEMLEDGWITDEYPNSRYLIFRQEGDSLSFLMRMFENDCFAGDEVFTSDLRRRLAASAMQEGEMP